MRTLRSGRTYGAVDPKAVPLPDEILLCIFEQLGDPFTLARIESVSRQWHRVARNHQHLWRDTIGIDMGGYDHKDGRKISPARTRHLIDQLCARSGGKLDRLALMLPTHGASIPDVEDVEYILQLLPPLHLKELWLEAVNSYDVRLGDGAPTCERGAGYNEAFRRRLSTSLVASIHRCEHLVELHVDVLDVIFKSDFQRPPAGSPLSLCRLQKFSLRCYDSRELFDDDSFCDMLQSTTHFKLEIYKNFQTELLSRLLQRACATLVHIDIAVAVARGQRPALNRRLQIHLPRLKRVILGPSFLAHADQAVPFELVCPALVHVDLYTGRKPHVLKALLGPEGAPIETMVLRSCADTFTSDVDPAAIGKLLNKYCGSTLRSLTVDFDAEVLLRELTRYPTMILDTIAVTWRETDIDALVNLVQSRLVDATHRPICDLAFPVLSSDGSEKHKAQVAWLRNHVSRVETYDTYNPFRRLSATERTNRYRRDDRRIMERRPDFFLSPQYT